MAVTPRLLSGSTNGKGVKITATAATGTTIHTAVTGAGATTFDEVYLWAQNMATGSKLLTLEYGGTTSPDNRISATIPSKDGLYLLVPGLRVNGGVVVRAFAASTSSIIVYGYVNRNA